jgi:hypothetical protein
MRDADRRVHQSFIMIDDAPSRFRKTAMRISAARFEQKSGFGERR